MSVTMAVTMSLSSARESRMLQIDACSGRDHGGGVYPADDGGSSGKDGEWEALTGR